MDEDTNRIYENISIWYEKWAQLEDGPHLFCPKIDDVDEEDYASPGPPTTGITAEVKQQRIESARERKELTYDLSLLLGISKQQVGHWVDDWIQLTESFFTKCDACILAYHMHRKVFLKKLRE